MTDENTKYKKMGIIDGLRLMKETMTYIEMKEKTGVNTKELCYMVNKDGYEPPAWVWAKLGLQVTKEVPLCPNCGEVHLKKGCPSKRPKNPNRTPGGWVNAKDPDKAAGQIKKRAVSRHYLFQLGYNLIKEYAKTNRDQVEPKIELIFPNPWSGVPKVLVNGIDISDVVSSVETEQMPNQPLRARIKLIGFYTEATDIVGFAEMFIEGETK